MSRSFEQIARNLGLAGADRHEASRQLRELEQEYWDSYLAGRAKFLRAQSGIQNYNLRRRQ